MKKRFATGLLAAVLSVALSATALPVSLTVRADETDEARGGEIVTEGTVVEDVPAETQTVTVDNLEDSDTLFAQYVDKQFSVPSRSRRRNAPRKNRLSGINATLYSKLAADIAKVANGESESAEFTYSFAPSDFGITKTSYTTDELGSADNDTCVSAMYAKLEVDSNTIEDALLDDLPYDLYWFDKTIGYKSSKSGVSYRTTTSGSTSITTYSFADTITITFRFYVASAYSQTGATGTYAVDTTKTGAAKAAAANAKAIVENAKGKSVDEALAYFEEQICSLVSYNTAAASNSSTEYGDPWQLIYVFDNDTSTNVVCEGYSKAFKYLCDLYKSENNVSDTDLDVYLVTGTMTGGTGAGPHMWNVVKTANGTFLVDVTNSDAGTAGSNGTLFMAKADSYYTFSSGEVSGKCAGYVVKTGSDTITYQYDSSLYDLYDESELKIDAKTDDEKKTYNITFAAATSVAYSYSCPKAAYADAKVTISSITPNETSYEVDAVTVKNGTTNVDVTDNKDGSYSFTMPAADVTVTITFKLKTTSYTITPAASEHGAFTVSATSAKEGDEIVITPTANSGYEVSEVKANDTLATKQDDGTYKFTMPAEDVTVTVTFVEKKYEIKAYSNSEGTISTDPSGSAAAGTTVTVTLTPASGYKASDDLDVETEDKTKVSVTGSGNTRTFTMPESNVSVTAYFSRTYSLTINQSENGTVTADKEDDLVFGDFVTLTITPASGYELDTIVVSGVEDRYLLIKDNTATFTMPGQDATVTATFKQKKYTVTKATARNGSFTVSADSAAEGDTVTIEATPDDGYKIDSVTAGDEPVSDSGDGKYSFTMPEHAVTISVTFKKDENPSPEPAPEQYSITIANTENGTVSVDKTKADEGETITITVTPSDGYEIAAVTANGSTVDKDAEGKYSFTMPAKDVEVSATFKEKEKAPVPHSVTVKAGEGGSAKASSGSAVQGAEITITAEASEGYKITGATADGVSLTKTGEDAWTFTMPDAEVTVTVTFEKEETPEPEPEPEPEPVQYSVSTASTQNGTISVDKAKATEGETVTITAAPADGYEIGTVSAGSANVTKKSDGVYTFTMPAADVEVSVTFTKKQEDKPEEEKEYDVVKTIPAAGGDYEISEKKARAGDTVTITITPQTGYVVDRVSVSDAEVTKISDTQYSFVMPENGVDVTVTFKEESKDKPDTPVTPDEPDQPDNPVTPDQPDNPDTPVTPDNPDTPVTPDKPDAPEKTFPFTDVDKDAFYYDAVVWAWENDVTAGTTATTFSPKETTKRAQMITFIWRKSGSPAASGTMPFTDVKPGDYCYNAVLWAYQKGITAGTSATTFSPDMDVTRAQMITFLYRWKGTKTEGEIPFEDVYDTSFYHDAVVWAYANGITVGTSSTTYSPKRKCSRCESITFLYREAQKEK